MAKICQVTGKKPSTGHNVSHSMRHTKRRFEPNLQKKTLINPLTGQKMTVRASARGLKNLSKNPIKWFKKLGA